MGIPNGHDDAINAGAGACVLAGAKPDGMSVWRALGRGEEVLPRIEQPLPDDKMWAVFPASSVGLTFDVAGEEEKFVVYVPGRQQIPKRVAEHPLFTKYFSKFLEKK